MGRTSFHMPKGFHDRAEASEARRLRALVETLQTRIRDLETFEDRVKLVEEVNRLKREVERLRGIIYATPR